MKKRKGTVAISRNRNSTDVTYVQQYNLTGSTPPLTARDPEGSTSNEIISNLNSNDLNNSNLNSNEISNFSRQGSVSDFGVFTDLETDKKNFAVSTVIPANNSYNNINCSGDNLSERSAKPVSCNLKISVIDVCSVILNKNNTNYISSSDKKINNDKKNNNNDSNNNNNNNNNSNNNHDNNDSYQHNSITSNKDIKVLVTASDFSFSISLVLPIKLPTIALLDREAAIDFVQNLIPKLYLESTEEKFCKIIPKLKMMQ